MRRFILAAASLAALAILALSPEVPRALAQFIPPTQPIQIGNTDLIPCTPGGVPTANQPYCQAVQLAGYVGSVPVLTTLGRLQEEQGNIEEARRAYEMLTIIPDAPAELRPIALRRG